MDTAVQPTPVINDIVLPPPPPAVHSHTTLSAAIHHLRSGLGATNQSEMERDIWTEQAADAIRKFDGLLSETISHRNRAEVAGQIIGGLQARISELEFKLNAFSASGGIGERIELTPAGESAIAGVQVAPSIPLGSAGCMETGSSIGRASAFEVECCAFESRPVCCSQDSDVPFGAPPPNFEGTLAASPPARTGELHERIADGRDKLMDAQRALSYLLSRIETLTGHAHAIGVSQVCRELSDLARFARESRDATLPF